MYIRLYKYDSGSCPPATRTGETCVLVCKVSRDEAITNGCHAALCVLKFWKICSLQLPFLLVYFPNVKSM